MPNSEQTDTEKEKILSSQPFTDMPKMRSTRAILSMKSVPGQELVVDASLDSDKSALAALAQQPSSGNVDANIAHSEWLDCASTKSSLNDEYSSAPPQHRHACISISIGP